jgi:hypothetical protein
MGRPIIYVVAALIVVTGVALGVARLRERARGVAADIELIRGDTGDVMASATYQRFATRREAVLAMKKALVEVASIESVFVADSGRPITVLPPGGVKFDPNKIGVSIWLLRDRWVATAQTYGNFSPMTCMITAMLDSTTLDSITWRYHAAAPRCADAYFNDSVLVLLPQPPAPEPAPLPVERAPAPRQHRDWGPLNNTPPPMPYIVKDACGGEGCIRSGTWAACSDVVALREKRLGAAVDFTIHAGEKFTALTTDIHVEVPGMVVFRHAMSNPLRSEGDELDSIAFTPADTLYLLNSMGEGYLMWWFRGQAAVGYQFWPTDTAVLVRPTKAVYWIRARNTAGQEGWLVGDYRKMATGGYMDEIERCLHPTKR